MNLSHLGNIVGSTLTSTLRGWRGTNAFKPAATQPKQMLELYDIENCPFCRLVRETLCELDLDVRILPCPRGGERFRPQAVARGGKTQFPFLHDPNTDTWMYESRDINQYLRETYGGKTQADLPHSLQVASSSLASATRLNKGMFTAAGKSASQDLELYSFESSPFSRLVREALNRLELPYILRNTAKAQWRDIGTPGMRASLFPDLPVSGRNREALLERTGKVQVPYLVDPNTGTEMFESDDIIGYLNKTYGVTQ